MTPTGIPQPSPASFLARFWTRPRAMWTRGDALVLALVVAAAVVCPFTKVEESFNVQAVHDFLFYGSDWTQFDHREFPSVVPRTCVGALALAAPFACVRWAFMRGFASVAIAGLHSKLAWLLAVRIFLAFHEVASQAALRHAGELLFGGAVGPVFLALASTQYHLVLWQSRLLPNMLALVLTNAALACWCVALTRLPFRRAYRTAALTLLTFATAVFRSELALFAGSLVLVWLFDEARSGRRALWGAVRQCIFVLVPAFTVSLAATIPLDTWFWTGAPATLAPATWRWPELDVFVFNVVRNQSHRWGVLPWHAYWTRFLPRLLHVAFPFALVAGLSLVTGRGTGSTRALVLPAGLFVTLYSFLPHKEWRFVVYAVPLFGLVAADVLVASASRLSRPLRRALVVAGRLAQFAGILAVLAGVGATAFNYPGGVALDWLHTRVSPEAHVRLHMDPETAMTGVSRFVHHYEYPGLPRNWIYDKSEAVRSPSDYTRYTHALTNNLSRIVDAKTVDEWRLVKVVYSLERVSISGVVEEITRLARAPELAVPAVLGIAAEVRSAVQQHGIWAPLALTRDSSVVGVSASLDSLQRGQVVLPRLSLWFGALQLAPHIYILERVDWTSPRYKIN